MKPDPNRETACQLTAQMFLSPCKWRYSENNGCNPNLHCTDSCVLVCVWMREYMQVLIYSMYVVNTCTCKYHTNLYIVYLKMTHQYCFHKHFGSSRGFLATWHSISMCLWSVRIWDRYTHVWKSCCVPFSFGTHKMFCELRKSSVAPWWVNFQFFNFQFFFVCETPTLG